MKNLLLILVLLFGFTSMSFGHGDGHSHGSKHPVTKTEIVKDAKHHMKKLMKAKKIPASWSDAKFDRIVKKEFSGKKEWVVTFENKKAPKGKQKIYLFFKITGTFLAANFSGK
jgi:hypothetical protein